jgi:hypothetical protein
MTDIHVGDEHSVEKKPCIHYHSAYKTVEQARNLFEAEASQLRESWAYDWIIPLVLADLEEVGVQYRIHSLHKIRAKLHELQTKMVVYLF